MNTNYYFTNLLRFAFVGSAFKYLMPRNERKVYPAHIFTSLTSARAFLNSCGDDNTI